MMTATAGRKVTMAVILDWIAICAAFVLAAAVISVPFALGMPAENGSDTGNSLSWWEKATQLFLWWLPFVSLLGALYAGPILLGVCSRTNTAVTMLASAVVGFLPAVPLIAAGALIPGQEGLMTLSAPVGVLGLAIAVLGTALWLSLRRLARHR